MPALIDIRRRIRSVKNTQQITKAMAFSAAEAFRRRGARSPFARHVSMALQPERGRR